MKHKSLNQLLCAATVNVRFREALLRDPAKAIASGYFDHSFSLTTEEQELLIGIQAQRLEDFAAQVYDWLSTNGNGHNGNGHNGNGHKRDLLTGSDRFVDLYRAPAMAHA
jgi:hypothetical protein